ncbi:hypothetical protein P280DRAFT_548095 [Massarina eburnea CBS 473.64]|uniref:RING-type domain-containing protein n=1 Tax=Massarina eburnea CBS 473.64 TaxID=1395130 RepID=A0A6A6S638_9PLEO|nr:hypothetical protein P280DRAFT_548095 [Massarina eburnea CBS 473.64]
MSLYTTKQNFLLYGSMLFYLPSTFTRCPICYEPIITAQSLRHRWVKRFFRNSGDPEREPWIKILQLMNEEVEEEEGGWWYEQAYDGYEIPEEEEYVSIWEEGEQEEGEQAEGEQAEGEQEEGEQEEVKQEEVKQEEVKQEEVKQEEEEVKQEEVKQEEVKQEEGGQEEVKQEGEQAEVRQEEVKQEKEEQEKEEQEKGEQEKEEQEKEEQEKEEQEKEEHEKEEHEKEEQEKEEHEKEEHEKEEWEQEEKEWIQEEWEDVLYHTAIKIKSCNHIFGQECLLRWLEEENTCPMCRHQLFKVQVSPNVIDFGSYHFERDPNLEGDGIYQTIEEIIRVIESNRDPVAMHEWAMLTHIQRCSVRWETSRVRVGENANVSGWSDMMWWQHLRLVQEDIDFESALERAAEAMAESLGIEL